MKFSDSDHKNFLICTQCNFKNFQFFEAKIFHQEQLENKKERPKLLFFIVIVLWKFNWYYTCFLQKSFHFLEENNSVLDHWFNHPKQLLGTTNHSVRSLKNMSAKSLKSSKVKYFFEKETLIFSILEASIKTVAEVPFTI